MHAYVTPTTISSQGSWLLSACCSAQSVFHRTSQAQYPQGHAAAQHCLECRLLYNQNHVFQKGILNAGLYLVSAGTDQLLVLWDVGLRKAVCKRTTPSTVSAVSWHPKSNSLACISEEGSVATWDGIVPNGHPDPHVSPDSLPAQGVTSPQEGAGERGGSIDPTGS